MSAPLTPMLFKGQLSINFASIKKKKNLGGRAGGSTKGRETESLQGQNEV